MGRPRWLRIGVVAVALAAAGCTGSTSPSTAPAASSARGVTAPSLPTTGGGGDIASIAACSLLTPEEIRAALGVAMKPGVGQTGTDQQAACQWASEDDSIDVGVTVQPYDDTLWTTLSSASGATPVSGIGEAAYKGVPHSGDLAVKQGGQEIDIGIVDFKDANATIDAAALALAKLVLPRV